MDAPEEDLDIKLQKISGDLIADFSSSLPKFLRKPYASGGGSRVRSRVRTRETHRLVASLLDPFQELPQLLDPHLPKWLPLLAGALLEYLQTRRRPKAPSTRSELLMPLPAAICKLLYTFCKIRGEKVVVRFLNAETRYLELLLSALEDAERKATSPEEPSPAAQWTWEERYVVLLWLSHLLLAPFDLSSISSGDLEDTKVQDILGLDWPANLPGITVRLLPLAIKYLSSPGKERDAAKSLLVRISMRKDMQQLGVLDALVRWALQTLRLKEQPLQTPYFYVGSLSFLAGVLTSSSDTSDMDKYLFTIFYAVYAISSDEDPVLAAIISSAVARKTIIKVIRSVTVLVLRPKSQGIASTELIQTAIGYLLDSLADNDTPVRLAASKALSIITLRLQPDMASQVVEAVLSSLNRNVLWVKGTASPAITKDLTSVNPLEWHGLMLTLSHLLYRRSPPAETLSDMIQALIMGLSFERRIASGGSGGTNVRDAACFGIWALARRYTTAELLAVPTKAVTTAVRLRDQETSVLQVLATELVVTASLDPAGNIRRAAAAALQELIGRHPDTVEKGIWVVQTVDYHAVALRARAIQEVSMNATKLSSQYGEAIIDGLLGWRGIGDSDSAARRVAAVSFGTISSELSLCTTDPVEHLTHNVALVLDRLKALQTRQTEERHGLLLSLAASLDHLPDLVASESYKGELPPTPVMESLTRTALDGIDAILEESANTTFRRHELIAEATSRLLISSFPLFQATALGAATCAKQGSPFSLLPGPALVSQTSAQTFAQVVSALDSLESGRLGRLKRIIPIFQTNLGEWLAQTDQEAIDAASEAALVFMVLCSREEREVTVRKWAETVRNPPSPREGRGIGYLFALTMSHPILSTLELKAEDNALICAALAERWSKDKHIQTRVSILQSLMRGGVLMEHAEQFVSMISEGLDDYTITARGDVGSHVRLQAIKATKSLWGALDSIMSQDETLREVFSSLFLRILRLAAEKLDRVRSEAQAALALALQPQYTTKLNQSTFSSQRYFRFLLNLRFMDWLHPAISDTAKADSRRWMQELMAGYVTSADTGNEVLVIASRAALTDFCMVSPGNLDAVCAALLVNLKSRQGEDRVVVPTLEIIAFLFVTGMFPRCRVVDYKNLCLQVQKANYKTGNVRKIEACIKVYGGVAGLGAGGTGLGDADEDEAALAQNRRDGIQEARRRLGALMFHPWPRVRSLVVDGLWGLAANSAGTDRAAAERLKGVDWGKAEKATIRRLVDDMGLN